MYKLTNTNGVIRLSDSAFIPSDLANTDWQEYLQWLDEGNTPQPEEVPTVNIESLVVSAVQQRLDSFAQTRSYDSILSLCTYATSQVPKFATEGQYGVNARDAHWAKCYSILADVQTGTTPMPSSVDEVLNQMPALAWPT